MKICYTIATYEGKLKRKHIYPDVNQVLTIHLDLVKKYRSTDLSITVTKPECKIEKIEGYYDSLDKADRVIECDNYGYSMGQWLKSYEERDQEYDYYIFMEDDYCPNVSYFDQKLVKIYKGKFDSGIGVLTSLVEGKENPEKGYPIHFEGSVTVSRKTLEEIYSCKKWKGKPREYLDKIDQKIDNTFCWNKARKSYLGGYYQLTFSALFNLIGIKHKDFLEKGLLFPYWDDVKGIIYYQRGDVIVKTENINHIINSIIVPIQVTTFHRIFWHSKLKTVYQKFPHRSPLDITEHIKKYTINKSVQDLGCGAGDILECLRVSKYAKSVHGVEKKDFKTGRKYIVTGDIFDNIIDADVYILWLGKNFDYNKLLSKVKSPSILIYLDGKEENQQIFSSHSGVKLIEKISYEYDESKWLKPDEKFENLQHINPEWKIKNNRSFKVYEYKRRKAVFVIGMHRSGTSLVSSYVESLGYNIGKTRNQDFNVHNPDGYFENDTFTEIHEKLLKYNGCSWKKVKKEKLKYTDEHVKEYMSAIDEEFGDEEKIIIKDPRMSFFVDLIKDLNLDIKIIFMYRNKDQTITSLNKAQGENDKLYSHLYDRTMSEKRNDMLCISYNDLPKDFEKICNFLGTKPSKDIKFKEKLYRNR